MIRTFARWLPAVLLLALFGGSFGLACSDDFEQKMRRPTSNPVGMSDALPEEVLDPSKQPEECPGSQPKEGETCPMVTRASISCRYVTRLCPNSYEVVQTMCCTRGGIWVPCGTYDPCPEGSDVDAAAP
jgi:hypothetical protein